MDIYCDADFIERARAADPLAADDACAQLPEMNRRADILGMAEVLRRFAGLHPSAADFSLPDSVAAVRDIGIFLGSIKRHGREPLELVPELRPLLTRLGARTEMVPRDTIYHYTMWNPPNRRQRVYTSDEREGWLQESVRMVLPDIRTGLELCDQLMFHDLREPGSAALMQRLDQHLRPMVASMTLVREKVTPEFFTNDLRPYLEDVTIDGTSYYGPAAAQLPIWLFDVALWGAKGDSKYETFWRALIPYALPRWRSFYERWSQQPPLVRRVADIPTATAVMDAIKVLVQFRGRHLSIAKQAYQLSSAYAVGSGGGSVDLLREILDRTHDAAGDGKR